MILDQKSKLDHHNVIDSKYQIIAYLGPQDPLLRRIICKAKCLETSQEICAKVFFPSNTDNKLNTFEEELK